MGAVLITMIGCGHSERVGDKMYYSLAQEADPRVSQNYRYDKAFAGRQQIGTELIRKELLKHHIILRWYKDFDNYMEKNYNYYAK